MASKRSARFFSERLGISYPPWSPLSLPDNRAAIFAHPSSFLGFFPADFLQSHRSPWKRMGQRFFARDGSGLRTDN